jgi:O-antigen/teichoic acid export membrane protein
LMLYFGGVGGILAVAYVCGYFAAMLFVVWRSRAPLAAALHRIEPARFKERAKVYKRLGVAGLLLHVFVSLPIVISGLLSPGALGDMGVVTRIWFLLSAPAAMAGSVLIPFLSTRDGAKRVAQLAMLATILGLAGWLSIYFFSSRILEVLFGVNAAVAGPALAIFVGALPMIGVVSVLSAALIAVHEEKQISAAYTIGTFVFSAYCLLWRPALSSVDLSAAWVVSYFAVAVYLLCVYFSLSPEKRNLVS